MQLQANEIDEIISRAMSEYNRIHSVTPIPSPQEEVVPEVTETTQTAIKTNSGSILVNRETSRFSGAIWYNKIREQCVVLAGLGGIGSYVAYLLARLHPKTVVLYDDDIVDETNMSGQLYTLDNIGCYKADATTVLMNNFSNYFNVSSIKEKYTAESELYSDIMICGFDNMEARKIYFNKWLTHTQTVDKSKCLFIDGRLAAEEFQVFAIQGDDERAIKEYQKKWLFSDAEADATICSYKQTSFCANMIASVMINVFVNFIANQCNPLVPRDVPFLTEYNAETMYFKVIQ